VYRKRFAATQALADVSLDLLPGEIHGLVGENGAGKSTVVKTAGRHIPARFGNRGARRQAGASPQPRACALACIAVVHQEPRLFPDLTVAENVFMGHARTGRFGSVNWREMGRAADRIFDSLGVKVDSSTVVRVSRWPTSN